MRVTRDAEDVREALGKALSLLLWYLARGLCLFATMAWLSPRMALLTALALPLLLALPRAVGHFRQVWAAVCTSMCLWSPPCASGPLHVPSVTTMYSLPYPCAHCPLHVSTILLLLSPLCDRCPSMCPMPLPCVHHPCHVLIIPYV